MKLNRIVIAVDGLSGSGKTTLSKQLAEKLGFLHFSSGSLYRVVGYMALKDKADLSDEQEIEALISRNHIQIKESEGNSGAVFLNGQNVERHLRSPKISEATSIVSQHPKVRRALEQLQRNAFEGRNIVAEGRDMGTVIFPDALIKFFVEVDEETRVNRRLSQLKASEKGNNSRQLKQQMSKEISERDKRDATRSASPVKPAQDAIQIDNSGPLTEVVQRMYYLASQKIESAPTS